MINRQQHTFTCGPVAILNALEWLGVKPFKYKEFVKMVVDIELGIAGMWFRDLLIILRFLGVKHRALRNPVTADIERELEAGNSVIFLFRWVDTGKNEDGGHYIFIDAQTDTKFRAWNLSRNNKTPWIKKSTLQYWIQYSHSWWYDRYTRAVVVLK